MSKLPPPEKIFTENMKKSERLFLYIDILNFSNIISEPGKAESIYNIIDGLNVFLHDPAFKCIVFSDTIIVYSDFEWSSNNYSGSSIMWMCEFAQDLFYRLIGRDVHFRAILTKGEFYHNKLKNIDAFFGESLVRAYKYEKEIICMGLFMDKNLVQYSDIFKTIPYDINYNFVYIMQNLVNICEYDSFPITDSILSDAGIEYFLAYDFYYLKNICYHMNNIALHPNVRAKYLGTWQMLKTINPLLFETFERSGLNPKSICDLDWSELMHRVETHDGFFG